MKHAFWAGASCLAVTGMAQAGGIDRSGQPLDIIFREGNFAEISLAYTGPDVAGDDISGSVVNPITGIPVLTSARYDDVAKPFTSFSGGVKYDITPKLSFAFIGAEDFGADVRYDDIAGSNIGGTEAIADTYTLSLIGRYRFTENWSVHGGVRAQWASGNIRLDGAAYGGATQTDGAGNILSGDFLDAATGGLVDFNGVSGYRVEFERDLAFGYLVGGAFELPQYAARIAVTYYSEITHDFETRESFDTEIFGTGIDTGRQRVNGGKTDVTLPQSVNIDFQTGVAENTLVFGSVRWAEWTAFEISPENFGEATNADLVVLDEDTWTYKLGVAHRLNDNWIVSAAYTYEPPGDRLKSPLAPTTGFTQLEVGARYTIDRWEISGGLRYRWLGDAKPETGTPDVARADFEDNTAITAGLRIGYAF